MTLTVLAEEFAYDASVFVVVDLSREVTLPVALVVLIEELDRNRTVFSVEDHSREVTLPMDLTVLEEALRLDRTVFASTDLVGIGILRHAEPRGLVQWICHAPYSTTRQQQFACVKEWAEN
jgi:hypothetical protein